MAFIATDNESVLRHTLVHPGLKCDFDKEDIKNVPQGPNFSSIFLQHPVSSLLIHIFSIYCRFPYVTPAKIHSSKVL